LERKLVRLSFLSTFISPAAVGSEQLPVGFDGCCQKEQELSSRAQRGMTILLVLIND
jgi:hypothetical protein